MRRREFIAVLGGAAVVWPFVALAQVSTKRPLIAVVIGASQAASERWRRGLPQGLQELGYVEGRDYEIKYRYAEGDLTRQPALVDELIRHKPNVIVAGNSAAALAAKQATASIPIVVAITYDPVGLGLVASHARPKENVTGIFVSWDSLGGKQLELGLELMPGAKQAGLLLNVNSPATGTSFRQGVETAAQTMAANVVSVEVRVPADIDIAFQTLAREQVNIVIVTPDPLFLNERRRIAELAIAARLPVVCGPREHVQDGGLMSYGAGLVAQYRTVGVYAGRVLKGEKPTDLPVQQATKVELIVNLKTAKVLGIEMPTSILLRADEVIE